MEKAADPEGPNGSLKKIIDASEFFNRLRTKRDSLDTIKNNLQQELGLDVVTQGTEPMVESIIGVQVVFLDWRLGSDHDNDSKVRAAKAAREIYDKFPEGAKPIIVLM